MHCIGSDLEKNKSVWVKGLSRSEEGDNGKTADRVEFCCVSFHPLSNSQINTDICSNAWAQLKNKCGAAFDTSLQTRSHYLFTCAFCQFSHSCTHRDTRTFFHRELYSKRVFDAASVCTRPVFPLCKRKKIGDLVYPQTLLLGFLTCVQLTPLSHVIANDAHKVTMLVCCAAPTSAHAHTIFAGTLKAHLWGNQ